MSMTIGTSLSLSLSHTQKVVCFFWMEFDPSLSMTINPFYGISTLRLGQPSSLLQADHSPNGPLITDFIGPTTAVLTFAPANNASLHGLDNSNSASARVIWDFSQRTAVIPTTHAAAPDSFSSHPTPPPISNGYGSVVRAMIKEELAHIRENDQRVNDDGEIRRQCRRVEVQNDGNSTTSMIKGQWTPDEDRFITIFLQNFMFYIFSLFCLFCCFYFFN